jgi:hypothetical protein
MNDIFKLFKKRAQAGKGTNITDVIKDLNEKEQSEIMDNKFDRQNKSYISISKSGRLKSKKTQGNTSRILNDELFSPSSSSSSSVSSASHTQTNLNQINNSNHHNLHLNHHTTSRSANKPIYVDQYSDNADSQASSSNSSFQSSL